MIHEHLHNLYLQCLLEDDDAYECIQESIVLLQAVDDARHKLEIVIVQMQIESLVLKHRFRCTSNYLPSIRAQLEQVVHSSAYISRGKEIRMLIPFIV